MTTETPTRESLDAAHRAKGIDPETLLPDEGGDDQGGDADALFDGSTFTVEVGGQNATTQKIRLYGGAVEIEAPEGGWVKGKHYVLRVEALCHKDGHTDEFDNKTGDVVGCRREFGLKIRGAAVEA